MNYYIHHINPVVLHIGGPLAIRWYGLSYLLGFLLSFLFLRRWSAQGSFEVPREKVSDFVVQMAFFGVFLGGRLGYVLFYGLDELKADPLFPFKLWEGGMSSHGGILGVILFMAWYARRNGYSFWNLADHMACVAPLGFAFGRIANFINGELWGRVTTVPWAVVFPQEAGLRYGQYTVGEARRMVEAGLLHPRHPSQLYQSACEGFLVFFLMMLLRRTKWGRRPGALSAAFLFFYAVARIAMEFFREPDSTVYFGWMTKGQLYSLAMILTAAGLAWKRGLFRRMPQAEN